MNTTVIIASGKSSFKFVGDNGQSIEITPYVVADHPGPCSLGIGWGSPGATEGSFWGLIMPHRLLQSWRAMKLLERVPKIDNATLCYCWYAASLEVWKSDQYRLDSLEVLFGSRDDFVRARAEVLASVPSNEEMEGMLRIVHQNEIELPEWEMKEINALFSSPPPSLEEIMVIVRADSERRSQERETERKKDEAELAAAQPKLSSLSWFRKLFA